MKRAFWSIALSLTGLLGWTPAISQAANPQLENLPDNTWVTLNPTNETPARTYAGAVYDNVHNHVLYFGGGDFGYWGNQVSVYDPVTNDWTDAYAPEAIASYEGPMPGAMCTTNTECPGATVPASSCSGGRCRDCRVGDPPELWNATTPLGRPWVAHTEDQMTFANGRLLMHGGIAGKRCLHGIGTTWEYNPETAQWTDWSQAALTGSNAAGALAYDADTNLILLRSGAHTRTLVFNPTTHVWTERFPTSSPPQRLSMSLDYDARHKKFILFGGYAGTTTYGDTWAYDMTTNTWTNLNPANAPPPRGGAGMVYLEPYGVMLLWGGQSTSGIVYNDTWIYDYATNSWTPLSPSASPPIFTPHGAMVYDVVDDVVILLYFLSSAYASDAPTGGKTTTWAFRYNPATLPAPDTTPPSVSFTAPQDGATVSGLVYVKGGVSDNRQVSYTRFLVDGVEKQGSDQTTGFFFSWDTTSYPDGLHTLTVTATDPTGNIGSTSMSVQVQNGSSTPPNQAPSANAGVDQTIQLPLNSVTLIGSGIDSDGTISIYTWTQLSGPSVATLSGATTSTLIASNLLEGTYQFRLTVTDDGGATATDTVYVIIQATTPPPPPPPATGSLPMALTIQELLPADDAGGYPPRDVIGRSRTQEPVTSGIPLTFADNITDLSQLAVEDSATGQLIPAQFRILKRHNRSDGSPCPVSDASCSTQPIQWVLVDLQADVSANQSQTTLRLIQGANPPGSALAQDNGSSLVVNTGVASFTIRKANQNVIDQAVVNGLTLLPSGHPGGITHVDSNNISYTSRNDPNSTALIEENGPLKAIIKEEGRLIDVQGKKSLGYTTRLTFYKNKSYVKSTVSIENAFREPEGCTGGPTTAIPCQLTSKTMKSIALSVPLTLGSQLTSTFSTNTSTQQASLDTGDRAYLYQANTEHKGHSSAVAVPGSNGSFFSGESDWKVRLTSADLDLPTPPYDAQQRSLYPPTLIGTTLILSVDGGPDQTITFQASDRSDPSLGQLSVWDVGNAISSRIQGVTSYRDGFVGSDPGFLRIRSLGTVGRPSIVIRNGTANTLLGVTNGMRADGQNGYTIQQNSTTLLEFAGSADYTRGFGDLSDSGGAGLSVAMRDFDSFYPSSITLQGNGGASIELFSPYNAKTHLTFQWGIHESRDLTLHFHATANPPEADWYRLQYPLFLRAPYEQYRDASAILGRNRLVTLGEMQAYHSTNVLNGQNQFQVSNQSFYGITSYVMPNEQIVRWRGFDWSEGGRLTNNDLTLAQVLGFLQTGHGGLYQSLYNLSRLVIDQAIYRSDRESRTIWPFSIEDWGIGGRPIDLANNSKFEQDMEHENVLGVPLLYYLTGDQGVYEALVDHGEWFLRDKIRSVVECDQGYRGHSQRAKWHSTLWELTGDPRYKSQMDVFADTYVCATIANPANLNDYGMDLDRGYWWRGESALPRQISVGPDHIVRGESLHELWRALPLTDPRKQELADRLIGHAYFTARESYFDRNGDSCRGYGFPPQSSIVSLDGPPLDEAQRIGISGFNQLGSLAFAYERTKDPLFLYVGRRTVGGFGVPNTPVCGSVESIGLMYSAYESWPAQAMIYDDLHQSAFDVKFFNDDTTVYSDGRIAYGGLGVTKNPDSSYTLSWTVPPDAQRYQIKYGPQIMVPNLNFDRDTRTYQYDPGLYDNFWAGNGEGVANQPCNIPGVVIAPFVPATVCPATNMSNPVPAAPGTTQTFTVTGLDVSKTYRFALKVFTDTTTTPTPGTPGDLNADGLVDAVDLQLLVNVLLGTEIRAEVVGRADLDGQGGVSAADLQQLVNRLLGI